MQPERIQVVLDHDIEPIPYGELKLCGSETSWSGFAVEALQIPKTGRLIKFSPYHHLVALCVAGHGSAQIRDGSNNYRFALEPGTASIFTSACELSSVTWSGAHEVLLVEICESRLVQWMVHEDVYAKWNLSPQFGFKDREMAALMCNMREDIAAGCPMGHLYGESLSLALTFYLYGRYASSRRSRNELKPKLSLSQVRRVQDYIHAHLAEDLTVSKLAGVVELSPHYFSYVFKNAIGITPHRYVLGKRINEGRSLLAKRQISILEVALTLGFASQSHFTDVFRKVTGTTPRRFRREH
ncbi:MAG: AraC family transcriptional regulator [Gammaproteobacteria bacterium]|nr:AraC family transcriptional regulator [Gammaproteobacteria bacterium]MDH3411377.1 AraC family transcriptional regulator [Gammaproteobacteria bacterium]